VRGTFWLWRIGIAAAVLAGAAPARGPDRRVPEHSYRDWKVYGGGPEGLRYSSLDEINCRNVARLATAWTFDTGDAFSNSEMQCNPIVVDGVLYATTPKLRVIALDAATGALRWAFEPPDRGRQLGRVRNRGVTYWEGAGQKRIYVVARQYLYALDARTGALAAGFGDAGRVDLREGLGRDPTTLNIGANTPGIVHRDLLILGSITSEALPRRSGGHPRLRPPHGPATLELPHDSASRRDRLRHVA
jgi:quinoprotein glucose dehydrogenase